MASASSVSSTAPAEFEKETACAAPSAAPKARNEPDLSFLLCTETERAESRAPPRRAEKEGVLGVGGSNGRWFVETSITPTASPAGLKRGTES